MTPYDIAIVGSGIACSLTLCQLLDCMKKGPTPNNMLRVCVIEKEGECWSGIPYGRRSTVGALAFQKLQEFLDEPERGCYIRWLAANMESLFETFKKFGGLGAQKWISDNQPLIDQNRWEELYLPRFLFGLYVSDCTDRAVNELSSRGFATVTVCHGEAIEASRVPGGPFTIVVERDGVACAPVHAARVVLAVGSPPTRSIHNCALDVQNGYAHIDDLYSPSEDVNISRIKQCLSHVPDRKFANILIVGSNASGLEVLYLIAHRPDLRNLVNSVVVLSRSGQLPYRICDQTISFDLLALESVCNSPHISADDVMTAIKSDLRRAEEMKLNVADLRDAVGVAVGRALGKLDIREHEKFVCEYGVHYSRLMRRAGRDTRDAADELASAGIVTTLKGNFCRLDQLPSGSGPKIAIYSDPGSQAEIAYPVPFSVTINCGGFEDLDCCSSRLINSVVQNRLCTVNSTKRGFFVNERLEASEQCYVIGPLLAGNFNDACRYWHVESASRIAGLARLLAKSLCSSLLKPVGAVAQDFLLTPGTQNFASRNSPSVTI